MGRGDKPRGNDHEFRAAVWVDTSPGQLNQAANLGRMTVRNGDVVDVAELVCRHCQGSYQKVFDKPCAAKIDNSHLIGGKPNGERAKRLHQHDCLAAGCDTAVVVAAKQQTARAR
ncbi:hypothetical protein [Actinomadura yumaensis]|uniref:HNH endonuclease n=1 Tax=Actinomadura yumaensis TaxID=111807 RepID=A0ABW2CT39_9ACTN